MLKTTLVTIVLLLPTVGFADWRIVYTESFDKLAVGSRTGSKELSNWESGSAAGVVFDGQTKDVGRFLIASSSWTAFNQGPIFNLDLTTTPHDQIRVKFDLYTFGDWRGNQQATGGPLHRLMFFDSKANPRYSFDASFSTNEAFVQSWPERSGAENKALRRAVATNVDSTGRFKRTYRWPIEFVYPSDSSALRFTILCGAATGSGKPMPAFGIDNVEVSVQSTAPTIELADRQSEVHHAGENPPAAGDVRIDFEVGLTDSAVREERSTGGRTSIGIFDKSNGRLVRTLWNGERAQSGRQSVFWDGRDNRGRIVPSGQYGWRVVTTPGFTARYITTIGINPPGGEYPQPRRSWVGDHVGAGIVDVDDSGVYVGSPTTEGLMMLLKVDRDASTVVWRREQFYQSGRLTKVAASGTHVFILHPNGKLRRLDKDTGRVQAEWQIAADGQSPIDVDANGRNLVVAGSRSDQIRWLSVESGQEIASANLVNPSCVAAADDAERGRVFAASGRAIYRLDPTNTDRVADLDGSVTALDFDPHRKELWAVIGGHRVVRLDKDFRVAETYGSEPREFGPYDPTRFAGIYDVAADLRGGFYVGEPSHPPRRVAHVGRDGSIINEWFGGMSFYVGGAFDPADPTRFIGIAPEGTVNVYRIDFESGTWKIEETYSTGRLGDSLFPNATAFKTVRRGGQLFLYHRVIPAVLRLDPKQRRAVPVAIAGRVINKGRTFFQFAGSGRDGYPKPWVAAAEHHGYADLSKAPKLYSWADSNGNGQFEPREFRFYPDAARGISFHNPGDFTTEGHFIGSARTNEPQTLVRLPVGSWEGPDQNGPRWDWNQIETAGDVIADSCGYGSPRGVSVAQDDSVSVAYQAGIMIREHGQYEGGGWPEAGMRGSRLLAFDSRLQPKFAVGRQSKIASEESTGVLYYPMQTTSGPNRSIIVNDQTKQPAQVWTHDGLYVGGFFDNRVDDGLADGFYKIHGDDNQGATVITAPNGKTYWLSPYQGHNRLYEITGWNGWNRTSGTLHSPPQTPETELEGKGLTGRYYKNGKLIFETTEPPIYFERFNGEPHADRITPLYKAVWTGFVHAPVTDRFQWQTLIGKSEQVAVWIDGTLCHANGFGKDNLKRGIELTAKHTHHIRIEYINPDGRAELQLLWSSRILDPQRLPTESLFPNQ